MRILFYIFALTLTALGSEAVSYFAEFVLSAWLFAVFLCLFHEEYIKGRATSCKSKNWLKLTSFTSMSLGLAFAYFDSPVLGAFLLILEYLYFDLVFTKIKSMEKREESA